MADPGFRRCRLHRDRGRPSRKQLRRRLRAGGVRALVGAGSRPQRRSRPTRRGRRPRPRWRGRVLARRLHGCRASRRTGRRRALCGALRGHDPRGAAARVPDARRGPARPTVRGRRRRVGRGLGRRLLGRTGPGRVPRLSRDRPHARRTVAGGDRPSRRDPFGGADDIAPPEDNADVYAQAIPGAELRSVGAEVGHYAFIGSNPEGSDVRERVAREAVDFFAAHLRLRP